MVGERSGRRRTATDSGRRVSRARLDPGEGSHLAAREMGEDVEVWRSSRSVRIWVAKI